MSSLAAAMAADGFNGFDELDSGGFGEYVDPMDMTMASSDLEETISFLCSHYKFTSGPQRQRVRSVFKIEPDQMPAVSVDDRGSSRFRDRVNLVDEVVGQVNALKALRSTVMSDNGVLREGVDMGDVNSVLRNSQTMLATLMRFQEKLEDSDRARKFESAVIDVLQEEDDELKARVLAKLEEKLSSL